MQTEERITEHEQESPAEQRYREVSTRLTLLGIQKEEAERALLNYCFLHPRMSVVPGALLMASDDAQREQLQSELTRVEASIQALLPRYADLKFSLGLTR